jgi:hypothetical protein
MAKMKGPFLFTGTIGDVTAYTRKGTEGVIVRRKGGPTKKQMKTKKSYANTRRNMAEFGGRSTAARWMRNMVAPFMPMAQGSFNKDLHRRLQKIQLLDTVSDWGKRGIPFSANPKLLEGLSLNDQSPMDIVLKTPIRFDIDKPLLEARLILPQVIPGINLRPPGSHPFFGFTMVLGLLPDLVFGDPVYVPAFDKDQYPRIVTKETGWLPVTKAIPEEEWILQLPGKTPKGSFSLLLSAGIRFGTVNDLANGVEQVNNEGSAKIIAMV